MMQLTNFTHAIFDMLLKEESFFTKSKLHAEITLTSLEENCFGLGKAKKSYIVPNH